MRVHVLGSGTPTPTPDRFGSCFVVDVGTDKLMFDCGPAATHKMVKAGLWPTEIGHVFFTHHHWDHNADLPCFVLCRWDQSRGDEPPLTLVGPPPTAQLVEAIVGEDGPFAWDWKARVHHKGSQRVHEMRGGLLPRPAPLVAARDIEAGFVHEGPGWTVTAVAAAHVQPYLDSLAYRIDTAEASVVITGDTAPCKPVTDLAQDADLLLCMCWEDDDVMDQTGERIGVCGTRGAARMATDASVGALALVHTGHRLSEPEPARKATADVESGFAGPVVFAEELMTIEVPLP